jgi:hypothetical protein
MSIFAVVRQWCYLQNNPLGGWWMAFKQHYEQLSSENTRECASRAACSFRMDVV